MRQLMISLDKKILDPTSAVARRMVEYGEKNELFIIIPHSEKQELDLSANVRVFTSWGTSKWRQFWELYGVGERILKKEKIESITAQDPFFTGLTAVWLKIQFKLPVEIQVHGDFYGNNYYRQSGLMNRVRWHLGKYTIKRADKIRTVGERVSENILKNFHITPSKVYIRPVPVDSRQIQAYEPKVNLHERYPGFEKIFLCLGRLDKVKNIPWLIKIFAQVVKHKPKYLLVIVGSGPEKQNLESLILNLKLDYNLKLEDWSNDPWSYIKTADCILFPSLSEGYGLVPMEASAAGTPIIMNKVGVANYELKPSDKVIILPINNEKKWIEAILSV